MKKQLMLLVIMFLVASMAHANVSAHEDEDKDSAPAEPVTYPEPRGMR